MPKEAEIQVLRGLAITAVVGFHLHGFLVANGLGNTLSAIFISGHSGLYFFFVVSSYLLWRSAERRYHGYSAAKAFMKSRIVRLYPLYFLITFFLYAGAFLVPSHFPVGTLSFSNIMTDLLLFPHKKQFLLGVAWFIPHLFLFYLFYSLRLLWPKIGIMVIFLWLGLTALFAYFKLPLPGILSFIFNRYNILFAFGIAGAVLDKMPSRFLSAAFWSGLLMIFLLSWFENSSGLAERLVLLFGAACGILLAGSKCSSAGKLAKKAPFFLVIGDASYSIYLTHYYTISFSFKIMKKLGISFINPSWLVFVLLMLIAVTAGIFVFHFIERPFDRCIRTIVC